MFLSKLVGAEHAQPLLLTNWNLANRKVGIGLRPIRLSSSKAGRGEKPIRFATLLAGVLFFKQIGRG